MSHIGSDAGPELFPLDGGAEGGFDPAHYAAQMAGHPSPAGHGAGLAQEVAALRAQVEAMESEAGRRAAAHAEGRPGRVLVALLALAAAASVAIPLGRWLAEECGAGWWAACLWAAGCVCGAASLALWREADGN